MSRQKVFVIVVVVAVIAFVAGRSIGSGTVSIMGLNGGNGSTTGGSSNPGSASSGLAVSILALQNDPTNKLYQLQGEYPVFSQASQLNQEVNNFIGSQISQFETNVAGTWQAEEATLPKGTPKQDNPPSPYQFTLSWEPAQLNAHYISFIVRIGADEGGANTTDIVQTFNYDLSAQKNVALGDLFPAQPSYLSKVASLCEQILAQELTGSSNANAVPVSMIQAGTAPTPQNFSAFTFTNGLVTIYFPKYQVAPGSLGEEHVTFAQSAIQ